jgi:hypothetical protein
MKFVLLIFSILAFALGSIILIMADGAVQEIEGWILYLISSVFLSSSSIIFAIQTKKAESIADQELPVLPSEYVENQRLADLLKQVKQ